MRAILSREHTNLAENPPKAIDYNELLF